MSKTYAIVEVIEGEQIQLVRRRNSFIYFLLDFVFFQSGGLLDQQLIVGLWSLIIRGTTANEEVVWLVGFNSESFLFYFILLFGDVSALNFINLMNRSRCRVSVSDM